MAKQPISREELISELENRLIQRGNNPCIIAIDGDSASGKSTLSIFLAKRFDANIAHIDSFYLPFDKRRECSSCHIDYPRILSTIIHPFHAKQALEFYTFNPHIDQITDRFNQPYKNILILEGSYSFHPDLRPFIDISIGMRISEQIQKERIVKRSSLEVYERFRSIWIPKEKSYQQESDLFDSVDYILETE